MELLRRLQDQFGRLVSVEEVEPHILRIYAPLFHEDGDMMSMYLDTSAGDDGLALRDFGNALMRVSYTFDIDTENKRNVLNAIVKSNQFRSLVVHEDFDGLTSFYRNQLTNAVDKQYTTFDDFKDNGLAYIQRELAS